jgi:ribosome-associated protein
MSSIPNQIDNDEIDEIEIAGTLEPEEAVLLAAQAAEEKKAENPVILDLRELASFTEFFLIANGANPKQVQAISYSIEDTLRKAGKRPLHIEGYTAAEWILLDYGDFIVHVFNSTARRFYDLERLWRDAKHLQIPGQSQ